MKKTLIFFLSLLFSSLVFAQTKGDNSVANSIVGEYEAVQNKDHFKVRITKNTDGSFKGQIYWMEIDKDDNGKKLLDDKNPDKNLRSQPADRIVLFDGLKYDAKKKVWNDTKIYDPQRGLRASMTAEFTADGRLRIKGSVLGISESVYWKVES